MRAQRLKELRTAMAAIEGRREEAAPPGEGAPSGGGGSGAAVMPHRVRRADQPRHWLSCPGIHEWFGLAGADTPRWLPPLGLLLHLAHQSLKGSPRHVVWIGRCCWPYPEALGCVDRRLLRRSIFIDPPDDMSRLWSIDLAARCPAAAVVVADGSGLDMAATRRLQLAAEAGSALVLCARPSGELKRLSAAATRWLVRSAPAEGKNPRWIIELLRCKGAQPASEVLRSPGGIVRPGRRRWTVEWKRVRSGVVVHAALLERPRPAAQPVARVRWSA